MAAKPVSKSEILTSIAETTELSRKQVASVFDALTDFVKAELTNKKGSGVPSITIAEALDVVLCWGWIDGLRKAFDERSYLQRYTPRRAKSLWSQINRDHVARLTKAGRMTPHGQRQVDAAKADGRWNAAYAPMRGALDDNFPIDLRQAIDASPRARKTFQSLGRQNLYALAFRTANMKTPAGRARKIAALVEMLERGERPHPERR